MTWIVVPDRPVVVSTTPLPPAVLDGVEHVSAHVQGRAVVVVKHDYQTWQRLRARGMVVPSPLSRYDWPGRFKPMAHQRETVEHFITHTKCFCFDPLGSGKSLSAIWAADYLQSVKAVRRVLVIAPLSITQHVWERELFMTLPHRRAAVLTGTRARKRLIAADTRLDWLIVNPESLELVAGHLPEVDLVIVDELTKFKMTGTRRYRVLRNVAADKRLWLMSGTPAPQAPTDAYGPIRLVNPEPISFAQFQALTMVKVSPFRWVAKPEADQVIARWMQPAIRHRREQCYDLPDVAVQHLHADLTTEQKRAIESFRAEARATIGMAQITAANAAAVLTKVLQCMAGFVYHVDKDGAQVAHRIPADPYFEAVERVVEQADTPVLVFVGFRAAAEATADYLESKGHRVGRILGGSGGREAVFDAVQAGTLDAVVAIPGTMSHGLTLTRARYVLWASPPFSFETYEQANGRVIRKGQKNAVVIYHLVQNSLAIELFRRLKSKERLQDAVLHLLEGSAD